METEGFSLEDVGALFVVVLLAISFGSADAFWGFLKWFVEAANSTKTGTRGFL